jgi:hypothetical protein
MKGNLAKFLFNLPGGELRIFRIAASLLLIALLALPCAAQTTTTARLEGVVQDVSGAVIPGAKVIAQNNKTQVSAETLTSEVGIFVFAALQPGIYTVTAEAQGFKKGIITNVVLNVSLTDSETFKLEVGAVSESVTVEANVEHINTTDGTVGRTVSLRDIDVLPQLGRTPITLSIFQPGVQIDPSDSTFSRINGLRQGSNNSTLDGIDVNDAVVPRLGLSMTANNADSVGEIRVVTGGGKAEYGRSAGGQVEMVTRSGGNRWSGNTFEYIRNTELNSNNFFNNSSNTARPKFIQNMFGGSLGGPIIHDKLFIFGNYQGRRTAQDTIRNRTVLTSQAKAGIFRYKNPSSGAIQSFDIVGNDPRKLGIDKEVAKELALLPDPNNFDIGDTLNTAGFRFNSPSGSLEDQFTIKGDYNISSNNHVFYRHSWQRNSSLDALNSADQTYPGQPSGTQGGHRWGIATGWDWTISPRLINEFRYGHQSAGVDFLRPREQRPLIVPNLYTAPLTTLFAQGRNSPVNEFTNNFTWVKEKHTFKAGANVRLTTQWGYNYAGAWANINLARANGATPPSTIGPSGSVISSTDRTTFENLYNDLLGRMSSTAVTYYSDLATFQPAGSSRIRTFKFNEQGYFFQDDWKVTRNLTFNLGIRWEFFGVPYEVNGLQGTLDQASAINNTNNLSNLLIIKTSKWYNNDWNNFAPRCGFAWAPGNGKTSIRGAYGMYYDRIIGATTSLVDGNTPGFSQAGNSYPNVSGTSDVRISDGVPIAAVPSAPVLLQPNNRNNSIVIFPPNLRTGYVHHFALSVQRELFKNTILDVGYVGTRGVKLFMDKDPNQARVMGDFLQSFQQLQAYRLNGTAVPATNTLVKMFGSVSAAITGVGGTSYVDQGLLGSASTNVDRNNYTKYAAAGVSDYYLRNYPQFYEVVVGGNEGRSYYDSLQVGLRRQVGALKIYFNYTFSKSIDNISVDGNGFTSPIDNFNLNSNRARGDYDRPHVANMQAIYRLPIGNGHVIGGNLPGWADRILGGWDLGLLGVWESGGVFTVSSGRATYSNLVNSWANYTGDRNIGGVNRAGIGSGGVYWFSQDQINGFSYPTAGSIGTSGRNAFRGPRYFDADMSLQKIFRISENHRVSFRAEAYNLFNNVNFANPGASIATPASFGKISATVGNARIMQMALRYDF